MAKRRKQEEEIIEPVEEVVFHEQFKEDFVEYGLYAIGSRAVPDVRDGLKPVQRRIIYGADKLGARAGSSYMKSARITGDVMGKYHPHGDCLDGDTEILLRNGRHVAIKELYQMQLEDPTRTFEAYAINRKGHLVDAEVSHVRIGQWANTVYEVTLSNGHTLRMTENHPVMMFNGEFVRADDLVVGQPIASVDISADAGGYPVAKVRNTSGRTKQCLFSLAKDALGSPGKGCVWHHVNEDKNDNSSANFKAMSRAEHAKHHYDSDKDVSLAIGRREMHSENGRFREATRTKNRALMQEVNCHINYYKARAVVRSMSEAGIEINNQSYELNRGLVYNAPRLETLVAKGYVQRDISELLEDPIAFDSSGAVGHTRSKSSRAVRGNGSGLAERMNSLIRLAGLLISEGLDMDYQTALRYVATHNMMPRFTESEWIDALDESDKVLVTITSIEVIETEPTPMYDFTVEGYENAIFKAGDSNVCLHNSSIYEAAVNMAQWWKATLTLVDGDGNWGNQQGQDAAAPRYTEMRLSKFGQLFVRDLAPGVVPFVPNYSNDLTEPTVLPVPFPYLLIAGSSGILTVGISANIPPHNAREVMAAVLAYIKNPRISDAKLLELIPGPDFPTAGTVLNKDEGQNFYLTGKGKFVLRGETERDKKMVVITEVPFTETGKIKAFQVSVDDLIFSKRILAATGAKNYSNKAGVRIEVGLKRESTPETLEAELYAKTRLQGNYFGNFTALRNGVPHVFTLREYLSDYVSFQYELLESRSTVAIAKLRSDLEIQNGLRTALDDINIIIELIQNTKKESNVLKCLTTGAVPDGAFKTKAAAKVASKFRFSEAQAAYILDTRLRRLNSLDRVAMERKIASMEKEIARLEKILSDPAAAKKELIKLQTEVAKIFEAPEFDRKTRLTNDGPITYVEEKKVVSYEVSVDKFGYLRMMAPGAAAVANEVTRFATDTEQKIGFFASDGAYHTVRVDKLKQSKSTDKGDTLASLGGLSGTTWPLVNSTMQAGGDQTLVFVTARGLIKSTAATEYLSSRTRLAGPALKDGDELVSVLDLDKAKYLVLVTSAGRAKRLAVSDIPAMSRKAAGNQSGRMLDGEAVVAAFLGDTKSDFEVGGKKHKFSDLPVDKPSTAFKKI